MPDKPFKILIADWIPSLNKGELAILLGILRSFESLGKVEVSIFSLCPEIDAKRFPPEVQIIDIGRDLHIRSAFPERSLLETRVASLSTMFQHLVFGMLHTILGRHALKIMSGTIWKAYHNSDVIIISHDQVSFIFGSEYTLFIPIYLNLLAKSMKKLTAVYAIGTYRLSGKLLETLAKTHLNNVDLTTLREEDSYVYLKELIGDKAPIFLTAEPAILMPAVSMDAVKRIAVAEKVEKKSSLLIGLTFNHTVLLSAYPNIVSPKERYQKAVYAIAGMLDKLTNTVDATLVFLPHCIEPYNNGDDREVAKDITKLMQNKEKTVVINKEYSPQELKGLMGTFDLIVGSRVHSVVNALSANTPAITLTRMESFMRTNGIIGGTMEQKEWIFVVDNFNPDLLLKKILDLIAVRNQVRDSLKVIGKRAYIQAELNGKLLKAAIDARGKR
jgi:polysaccharide pyruvyl transferase WcaK-like protein